METHLAETWALSPSGGLAVLKLSFQVYKAGQDSNKPTVQPPQTDVVLSYTHPASARSLASVTFTGLGLSPQNPLQKGLATSLPGL